MSLFISNLRIDLFKNKVIRADLWSLIFLLSVEKKKNKVLKSTKNPQ